MTSRKLIACGVVIAMGAFATACASTTDAGTNGEPVSDESAITFSNGPEGLAQWLGTNHSMKFMTQYLDTRGEPSSAVFPVLEPKSSWEVFPPLTFPKASASTEEVQNIIGFGREADSGKLPIIVGKPTVSELGDAFGPRGVYVYAAKAEWLAAYVASTEQSTREDRQFIDQNQRALLTKAASETTAEVTVLLGPDGEGEAAPSAHFAFGIVRRPLSNRPGAPVNSYWTLLAATYSWATYLPFAEQD